MKQVNSILDFADGAAVDRINYELQKILERRQSQYGRKAEETDDRGHNYSAERQKDGGA